VEGETKGGTLGDDRQVLLPDVGTSATREVGRLT
jgi:hypothetical protein